MSGFPVPKTVFFPHPLIADDDGFLGYGGDLHPQTLIMAYQFGIFPWYDKPPILWWAPKQRFIIDLAAVHIPKSMRRYLNKPIYTFTVDQNFESVIDQCQTIVRPNQSGTWITEEMKSAYITLHQMGIAHSVEIWLDDEMVGGLYGLGIGQIFSGESMFSLANDASKFAVLVLAKILTSKGYKTIDCQQHSNHMARLGGQHIDNIDYHKKIRANLKCRINPGLWRVDQRHYHHLP
ncbi:leucyl/phenylalanyl-tRNA--protein transferase [Membranihabitans marinus]|uniref:leucyl/phenylalanyl-tRNA--protein transferase n=1 Tax=Membranihabitans marinus TaxID=1227546 RepID=UPI001EFF779B|nr:leucyl/phenylalanyl-tRNA--protein transferase [Membranihabitans marinus]